MRNIVSKIESSSLNGIDRITLRRKTISDKQFNKQNWNKSKSSEFFLKIFYMPVFNINKYCQFKKQEF